MNNLGFADELIVLLDWGDRTDSAPAPVELASFLVFDARRFDVPRDEVIADFRALYGERHDETALQLALIGAMVQLGCNLTLPIVLGRGDEARAAARSELEWWAPTAGARAGDVVADVVGDVRIQRTIGEWAILGSNQ